MAWGKAGSTTLTSSGTDMSVTSMPNSKTGMALGLHSGGGSSIKLNADNGSNYASRRDVNGQGDSTNVNLTGDNAYITDTRNTPHFNITYFVNVASEEKLWINENIYQLNAGASNVPQREEAVGKWANTSDAISQFDYHAWNGTYSSGDNILVLGSDITPAAAVPAIENVQDNSLFVEKENARRYWFTPNTVTLQSDFSSSTGWTTSSSSLLNVDTSAQEIDFTFNVDNGDIGTMYYDLTSTSDTKWLLRSQVDIDTISQGSDTNDKWLFYGISSTNNGANETQDFLGMAIRVDNTKTELLAIETDGSAPNNESTTVFTRNAQAETLYVEMKRESATSFTVSLYSDSSYSTLLESKTITASSGTATLRYLKLSGLQGFSDSQIVGSIPNITFYNNATEPDTWIKQIKTPTNEDLEDQTWTLSTSDLTQGDSYIQWANMTGGTENGYYDLGSGSVSDTKWVLRAKLTISSYSSGGAAQSRWCGLGLSSSSSTFTGTQDSINIILRTNTSSDTIAATRSNGTDVSGQLGTAGISGVTLGNGTFYLELIRESDSDYKLYVRSDSHTGTLLGTGTYTNASGVTGLRYIKTDRLLQSSATGDFVAKWEDIDFWDGITEP